MKKHIERLKKKPEDERIRISIILAVITTVLIVLLWILILFLTKIDEPDNNRKTDFDILKEDLSSIGKDFSKINNKKTINTDNSETVE